MSPTSHRVFKKASPNGKLTIYLGRRDFVDHVSETDPIDGVLLVDPDYLAGKRVRDICDLFLLATKKPQLKKYFGSQIFAQLVCSFRYGREEDETLGLSFKKELTLADEQVFMHKRDWIDE